MSDAAHRWTDRQLSKLERAISKEYRHSLKEIRAVQSKFMSDYESQLKRMRADLAAGKIQQSTIDDWLRSKAVTDRRLSEMAESLSKVANDTNKAAIAIINGSTSSIFAENMNWATYQIEKGTSINTAFTLQDKWTVEALLKDDPTLLPKKAIDDAKDMAWNQRKFTSAITQGVLQGESIPKISKRLQGVMQMNHNSAIRNARTATTAAENLGRVNSYERAKDMGIDVKKEWVATLDGRTRHSHRMLDGVAVENDEKFGNGCRFPGDPSGPAWEVYNCRCTLVAKLPDVDTSDARRNSKLGDMSYEEWKNGLSSKPQSGGIVNGNDILGEWRRRPNEFEFEIEDVLNAQGYDGLPRLVESSKFDEAVKMANNGNGLVMQRTYAAPDQKVLDAYRDQLYHGKWYVDCSTGGAQYGQGMYCAADYSGKLSTGIKEEMKHYISLGEQRNPPIPFDRMPREKQRELIDEAVRNLGVNGEKSDIIHSLICDYLDFDDEITEKFENMPYDEYKKLRQSVSGISWKKAASEVKNTSMGGAVNYVETMTLDSSAKIITYEELNELYMREIDNLLEKGYKMTDMKHLLPDNLGSFAAAKGYDAINAVGHGKSGSYTIVLNRTKLIIRRP